MEITMVMEDRHGDHAVAGVIQTATAIVNAIPAVVAYNFFIHRVRVVTKDMENFSTDLINSIERHLRKTS